MSLTPLNRVLVRAPSNIALIKYMGKEDASLNLPTNGSLSLTLDSLCTFAEIARTDASTSYWLGEMPRSHAPAEALSQARVPVLSDSGANRVIRHVERVKHALPAIFQRAGLNARVETNFEIRTANTFPASSGIASSASSFAAVTLGVAAMCSGDAERFKKALAQDEVLRRALASLSRQGSGSSCRSYEGPWVLWEGQDAASIRTAMPAMTDFVILIGTKPKEVSSSDAHSLVRTSPLWEGRAERVTQRLRMMEAALGEGNLPLVSRIAWSEMWEMHSLFHTCADPFTYWEPGSIQALKWLASFVQHAEGIPPIVTMDAGANVHVLVPTQQAALWRDRFAQGLPGYPLLEDRQGSGASVLEAGA